MFWFFFLQSNEDRIHLCLVRWLSYDWIIAAAREGVSVNVFLFVCFLRYCLVKSNLWGNLVSIEVYVSGFSRKHFSFFWKCELFAPYLNNCMTAEGRAQKDLYKPDKTIFFPFSMNRC